MRNLVGSQIHESLFNIPQSCRRQSRGGPCWDTSESVQQWQLPKVQITSLNSIWFVKLGALTVVGVIASTELAMVERMSATVSLIVSWFSETGGVEYIISCLLKTKKKLWNSCKVNQITNVANNTAADAWMTQGRIHPRPYAIWKNKTKKSRTATHGVNWWRVPWGRT